MENLEIILTDFSKSKINRLIYDDLQLSKLKVKSSHFYDNNLKKDLNFSQVHNIEENLSPKGTGNIFLEELFLGIGLKNILIVFSFNEQYGDIVFNFSESELFTEDRNVNKLRLRNIVNYLAILKKNYNIPKVIIGYEPATDDDTMLLEIDNTKTNYDNIIEKIIS